MSAETLRMLRELGELAPFGPDHRVVSRYAGRHGLVLPKMMRKLSWRIMVSAVPREVARFLQSRLGELSVSEARYEDLLSEADAAYPRYLEALRARLGIRRDTCLVIRTSVSVRIGAPGRYFVRPHVSGRGWLRSPWSTWR
jgi:hypothetical protein